MLFIPMHKGNTWGCPLDSNHVELCNWYDTVGSVAVYLEGHKRIKQHHQKGFGISENNKIENKFFETKKHLFSIFLLHFLKKKKCLCCVCVFRKVMFSVMCFVKCFCSGYWVVVLPNGRSAWAWAWGLCPSEFFLAALARCMKCSASVINIADFSSVVLYVNSAFKQLLWLRKYKLKNDLTGSSSLIVLLFNPELCVEGFITALESHSNQKLICVSERGGPAID